MEYDNSALYDLVQLYESRVVRSKAEGAGSWWNRKKNTDEGKNSRRPLNGRCGGPHSRSGRFLEEKNDAYHCRESSHDSSVVPYAVITSTMLSQYHG